MSQDIECLPPIRRDHDLESLFLQRLGERFANRCLIFDEEQASRRWGDVRGRFPSSLVWSQEMQTAFRYWRNQTVQE